MSQSPVTVIVVTSNSATAIRDTLRAIVDDPDGPAEVIAVDSGSTDETEVLVRALGVEWLTLGYNGGYGAAIALGVGAATQPIVAVLSHDVTVRPGWLPPLVTALAEKNVGAAMATIELLDNPGHFNTSGGHVSATAMAWITDYGKPISGKDPVEVPFPSGAAFAMRRETWEQIGGMWSELFLYHEDTDLGWRLRMAGYQIVRVPSSLVVHAYEFGRNSSKLRLLERNRWLMLLVNYRRSTLLLLSPVLVVHECGVLLVALRDGWLRAKLGTWVEVARRRRSLKERYRVVQNSRSVGDAQILRATVNKIADLDIPGVRVPAGAGVVDSLTRWWVRRIARVVAALDRRRGLR